MFKPANLIAGFAVFRFTMFAPILTADAVMSCKDELPCTTKSELIYKLPVIVCVPINAFEPVVAYLPSIVVILPARPLVFVATDEDRLPTLEDKSDVVVATLELNEPILELSPDVVVATEPDKEPILLETDELNVE